MRCRLAWGRVMKLWKRKSDLLVEATLVFVQEVTSAEPHREEAPIQVAELVESVIQPNLPKPKDRLFEDQELQHRLSEFKAIQHRFEREREEFFNKRMSKVRPYLGMTFDHANTDYLLSAASRLIR